MNYFCTLLISIGLLFSLVSYSSVEGFAPTATSKLIPTSVTKNTKLEFQKPTTSSADDDKTPIPTTGSPVGTPSYTVTKLQLQPSSPTVVEEQDWMSPQHPLSFVTHLKDKAIGLLLFSYELDRKEFGQSAVV